jgi:hypothetical protein
LPISRQNSRSTSRRSDGAPGDFIADRPVNSFIHPAGLPINTSTIEVLRRPVDSSQFTSYEFAATLNDMGMRQSVGRTGICWDNAMAESFFGALKNEWTNRMTFATRAQARQQVVKYIEGFYNRRRLHSGLGYQTPLEVHNEYLNRQLAA